jgi:CBS domain containing-hemolysin-like protein
MSVAGVVWMVVLLFANGFFVASEFAYITARRNVLEQRATRASRTSVGLMKELSLSLAAAQLGITICSLLLGYVAEPAVASIIERAVGSLIDIPERALHTIALAIALTIVVFLHMVIGEMAPKNVAIAAPERAAVAMALPFRAFIVVFKPLIVVLNGIANGVLRLLGVKPADTLETTHSAEDLAVVIATGRQEGIIEDFTHRLLAGAIMFNDRDAYEVMVPRPDVEALDRTATVRDLEEVIHRSGHSRIPIHTGDLDDVLGFVHVKDLLDIDDRDRERTIPDSMIRPMMVVPESAHMNDVLTEMRRTRNHIAIVVDEHGGSAGIITMEDIAEELVGDIRDEHDPRTVPNSRLADGRLVISGSTRRDDTPSLGLTLPEGPYETVGGFVMDRIGRIPTIGDVVDEGSHRIRVRAMDGHRVAEVELLETGPPPDGIAEH